MSETKKLTILHANDFHGQISFKINHDLTMVGGISLLSGYVEKVRSEEKAVCCCVCGDILQGDIHDTDSKGPNTVKLINLLRPDAISLGNHELDYGLAHLLIFKECIKSPILCSNLFVQQLEEPLFSPGLVFETDGIKVLLIGVIPEYFLSGMATDAFFNAMISYKDSYDVIRSEIEKHKDEKIDLTIIMSHYGIEGDISLAKDMPDDIKVDVILGGHSHIVMEKPEIVNNTIIVQSNYGMTHIGRLEIDVDLQNGGVADHRWELVLLDDTVCDFTNEADSFVDSVLFNKNAVEENSYICRFDKKYEHNSRVEETELGDLVADIFLETYNSDFVIIQSASIRSNSCGPNVTMENLRKMYPYDDNFVKVNLSGREIRQAFEYLFSKKPDGSIMNGTFQYSRGFKLVVDIENCYENGGRVEYIGLNGEPIDDEKIYNVGVTKNCLNKFKRYFGLSIPEERSSLIGISTFSDLARWMITRNETITVRDMGRFEMINPEYFYANDR